LVLNPRRADGSAGFPDGTIHRHLRLFRRGQVDARRRVRTAGLRDGRSRWHARIAFAPRPISGLVFFDRSLVDAAAALQQTTGEPALAGLGPGDRYSRRVFLAPPWPETYVTDPERPHGLDSAVAEYWRLVEAYSTLGYIIDPLPRADVESRAGYILQSLSR
jgi:predicted ATPase